MHQSYYNNRHLKDLHELSRLGDNNKHQKNYKQSLEEEL